jgi:catechol 2,3-dioxygenase-like lactoylglutathione lyase family enzyme
MPLHRLSYVHVAVAAYDEFRDFYRRFGLAETAPGRFASTHGGEQLRVERADHNQVLEIGIGADSPEDLAEVAGRCRGRGLEPTEADGELVVVEAVTGVSIRLCVEDRVPPAPIAVGVPEVDRGQLVARSKVSPRRLGHMVLGCTDVDAANEFFISCLGMRVSDEVIGAVFLRFDTDHHNLALLKSSHTWLHHMAWKVGSVDDVGYGAMQLIDTDPRHNAYGLGRHAASANYFWYLRDPAGSLAEYYHSEFDDLVDDAAFWDPDPAQDPMPVASWGPPLPGDFFAPGSPPPSPPVAAGVESGANG